MIDPTIECVGCGREGLHSELVEGETENGLAQLVCPVCGNEGYYMVDDND